jgi:tripartite-type tricarboxylate transporter receptor subunit TctC
MKQCTGRIFRPILALLALATALSVAASDYPTRPIHLIVPYPPGGTADLIARTISQKVSEKLGQPVVIENRPGASGNLGMDAVAKAAPDGYTIGIGATSTNALNAHVYRTMAFDPRKDFTPVSLLGTTTIVLQVSPDLPVRTVGELVLYAWGQEGLTFGTTGIGTTMHLAGVLFAQMTHMPLVHVAYHGSAPAIADMLGGHLTVMFDALPASLPLIQSGRIRALAVSSRLRSPSLPSVPTLAEAGLGGYHLESWFGIYGPAHFPPEVVRKLNLAFVEVLAMHDVREKLFEAGFAARGSTPHELAELSRAEYERLGQLARRAAVEAN